MTERTIDVSYDDEADAAYLYLTPIEPGGVARTHVCAPPDISAVVNLDFDQAGKLVGIEVLNATGALPRVVLTGEATKGRAGEDRPTGRA